MTHSSDDETIKEILSDDLTKQIIAELGLEAETPESQADIIAMIGENVLQRVVIEIAKELPEEARQGFEPFIGGGDIPGMREYLLPYIPDLDRFIQRHAAAEFEATKTRIHMIEQGVEEETE